MGSSCLPEKPAPHQLSAGRPWASVCLRSHYSGAEPEVVLRVTWDQAEGMLLCQLLRPREGRTLKACVLWAVL